jgi:hypothetical protein
MHHRIVPKLVLAFYWLFFSALAGYFGQFPGYVQHAELEPYPWREVLLTCGALAIEVAILYVILRPFDRSWRRLAVALVYAGLLLVFGASTAISDMPGWFYVPAYFATVTTLILAARALAMGVATIWDRTRHES